MENVVVGIPQTRTSGPGMLHIGPGGSLAGLEGRSEHMYMPEFMLSLAEWLLNSPVIVYGGIATGGLVCLAYAVIMEVGFCLQNSEDWD